MGRTVYRFMNAFWVFLILLVMIPACVESQVGRAKEINFSGPQDSGYRNDSLLGPQALNARGKQHILMVAVRFPDVRPRFTINQIKERAVRRLNMYVKAQSYGLTWIEPHFIGWVSLPDSISEYRVSPSNFLVDRGRVRKLIEDTMTAIDKEVDFSQYQHMLIIPGAFTLPGRGYGMICYCANPGMLMGVRGNPGYVTLRSKGGKIFSGGIFVGTENAHLGMFAHDFFHALGGVYAGKRLVP